MLVETGVKFGDELEEAEALVLEGAVCDWSTEFRMYWLAYIIFAKWYSVILARVRRKKDGGSSARHLLDEWTTITGSTPSFAEHSEPDRVKLRAKHVKQMFRQRMSSNVSAYGIAYQKQWPTLKSLGM